ncbi:MAG: hypothetical protein Q9204_005472 [Flavoplaca sp. TL-2023a]
MPSIKNILLTLAFAAAVSAQGQLEDGQVTAVSEDVVSQITDGQIQAPTSAAAPVTQIDDGQIQAPTSAADAGVTQIDDGQIQAPTSVADAGASQIDDGHIQVPTGAASGVAPVPTSNGTFNGGSPAPFEGAATLVTFSGAAIGLAALAIML